MQEVTSLTNPLIKHLVKLREDKSYRQQQKRVCVSGCKLIKELSLHHTFLTLLVESGSPLPEEIRAEVVVFVPHAVLKKVTGLETPEPWAVELAMPPPQDVSRASFLLILDKIADPGNLGTLFRTALGLGWDGIFVVEGSVDPFNEKALRAAKGATFHVPWQMGSYETLDTLLRTPPRALFTADAHGSPVEDNSFETPLALILGNESHGPSSRFHAQSQRIAVQMNAKMESLNVAVAGAILMDQIKRTQR